MKKDDVIIVTDQDDMFYGSEGEIKKIGRHLIEVQLVGVTEIQRYLPSEIQLKEVIRVR